MFKRKQPEPLTQLCIQNWVLTIKKVLISVHDVKNHSLVADCISSIMSTLPQSIGETISQQILNTVLEVNCIKDMMNTENNLFDALITALLHPQMRYLDIRAHSRYIGRAVWKSLPNLKFLEYLSVGEATLYKIPTPVKFSSRLVTLTCHYECTTIMIKELAENCLALRKLDIRYSKGVLDAAVPELLHMRNLCALQVEKTGLSRKVCFHLLYKLTTLQKFDSDFCLIKMLQAIHDERQYPHLTEVSLHWPIRSLLPLSKLKYLTKISISVSNYVDNNLQSVIKDCGKNLHTLHLDLVDAIFTTDIVKYCPNLKNLSFKQCKFQSDFDWNPSLPHFNSVEELTFEYLSNDYLKKALSQGWLKHIRVARFRHCGSLSIPILDSLLTSCNELSVVGDISEWYGVTPNIIELVQNHIKLHNYDLTLL